MSVQRSGFIIWSACKEISLIRHQTQFLIFYIKNYKAFQTYHMPKCVKNVFVVDMFCKNVLNTYLETGKVRINNRLLLFAEYSNIYLRRLLRPRLALDIKFINHFFICMYLAYVYVLNKLTKLAKIFCWYLQ